MEVSHLLLLLLSLFALATASNSPQKSKVSGSSSEDDDTEIVTDTGITNIRTTQVRDGETTIRYSYAHKSPSQESDESQGGGSSEEDEQLEPKQEPKNHSDDSEHKDEKPKATRGKDGKRRNVPGPKRWDTVRKYLPGKKTVAGIAVGGLAIGTAYFCCGTPDSAFFDTCGEAWANCVGKVCEWGLNRVITSCPTL